MTVETWTQADLERLIGQEESSNLEFKRVAALENTDGKKSELVKDVVALANAAGGTIVYGIVEGEAGVAASLDVGTNTDPLWVEQILDSNIEPRIAGVIVARIALETGGHAIAIEVPQATSLAPHQSTRDHRYYRRHGRKVLAMLDHEVRDLMRRGSTPHLHFMFQVSHIEGDVFRVTALIGNLSSAPAEYGHALLAFESSLDTPSTAKGFEVNDLLALPKQGHPQFKVRTYSRSFIPPTHLPIFREQDWSWLSVTASILPESKHALFYKVSCPGFAHTRSGRLVREKGSDPQLVWWDDAAPEVVAG